jgi:hypothetical protein
LFSISSIRPALDAAFASKNLTQMYMLAFYDAHLAPQAENRRKLSLQVFGADRDLHGLRVRNSINVEHNYKMKLFL